MLKISQYLAKIWSLVACLLTHRVECRFIHTMSQKTQSPQLHQMLTDFLKSFTDRLSWQFATTGSLKFPPHPGVTTLTHGVHVQTTGLKLHRQRQYGLRK